MSDQDPMPKPGVATIDEVAKVLRISRGSAYAAAKRGEIPTIKIGDRVLVPLGPLNRMLGGADR